MAKYNKWYEELTLGAQIEEARNFIYAVKGPNGHSITLRLYIPGERSRRLPSLKFTRQYIEPEGWRDVIEVLDDSIIKKYIKGSDKIRVIEDYFDYYNHKGNK